MNKLIILRCQKNIVFPYHFYFLLSFRIKNYYRRQHYTSNSPNDHFRHLRLGETYSD